MLTACSIASDVPTTEQPTISQPTKPVVLNRSITDFLPTLGLLSCAAKVAPASNRITTKGRAIWRSFWKVFIRLTNFLAGGGWGCVWDWVNSSVRGAARSNSLGRLVTWG